MTPVRRPTRAAPLPPDERRAGLVDATVRLLAVHGREVTTRQIAEAAGVAEGTIFRVFPSKDALVDAALQLAFEPSELLDRLFDVDVDLPLRERLIQMVTIIQERFVNVFALMAAVGMIHPPDEDGHDPSGRRRAAQPHVHGRAGGRGRSSWRAELLAAMVDLIGSDADELRCSAHELAGLLRLLTFSGSHAGIADDGLLSPTEIVDVVLYGVGPARSPAPTARCSPQPAPQPTGA